MRTPRHSSRAATLALQSVPLASPTSPRRHRFIHASSPRAKQALLSAIHPRAAAVTQRGRQRHKLVVATPHPAAKTITKRCLPRLRAARPRARRRLRRAPPLSMTTVRPARAQSARARAPGRVEKNAPRAARDAPGAGGRRRRRAAAFVAMSPGRATPSGPAGEMTATMRTSSSRAPARRRRSGARSRDDRSSPGGARRWEDDASRRPIGAAGGTGSTTATRGSREGTRRGASAAGGMARPPRGPERRGQGMVRKGGARRPITPRGTAPREKYPSRQDEARRLKSLCISAARGRAPEACGRSCARRRDLEQVAAAAGTPVKKK